MRNNEGFDLWAEDYDESVERSDEADTYPFAGYQAVLRRVHAHVHTCPGKKVLDIGFGTGTLTTKLYKEGYSIYGQDFSEKMIALAQEKMPDAKLYQGDFTLGLVEDLQQYQYDAIIATYSLHHLTDAQKVVFLLALLPLLSAGGGIYIGDVAFESRKALERCMAEAGDAWDDEEYYCVFDELKAHFPAMKFEQISACAGVLSLQS